ncbi:glycosyltransferase family 2 protein [uncultured Chryseobacterium sp.]|uniref:glycosyltransferase family 2 protein n=1 Tax=uncultured Chryseobacterium sp. TaxID=259322 RepID=UPI0025E64651|nr:glycosyltransferase family 2 protein [uncultured Chryseobacterium sp.]
MKKSLVSICIPTYNGEKYLRETLHSVQVQTYRNIEVIISDDESEDDTVLICEQFKSENPDIPVHIYSHSPTGIGANWNYCIEKANGQYIKLLFQDDVMENNCIEKLIHYIDKYRLEIVVSKRSIINSESDVISCGQWYDNYKDLQVPAGLPDTDFYILSKRALKKLNFDRYSQENIIGEPTVSLFKRNLYYKTGPFNNNLKQILDYEYWLRVLSKYNIGIIGQKLVKFRFHEDQASFVNSTQHIAEGPIIKDILYSKFLFYLERKKIKEYFIRKYPLVKKLVLLRYKLFS